MPNDRGPIPPPGGPGDAERVARWREARWTARRANAESNRPTLYYAPPAWGDLAVVLDRVDRIVREGFEDEAVWSSNWDGVLLWAFSPDEQDEVSSEAQVEVMLDCSVAEYEYREQDAAGAWIPTGQFLISAAFVNAHTVPGSRRRIIPDFEFE